MPLTLEPCSSKLQGHTGQRTSAEPTLPPSRAQEVGPERRETLSGRSNRKFEFRALGFRVQGFGVERSSCGICKGWLKVLFPKALSTQITEVLGR